MDWLKSNWQGLVIGGAATGVTEQAAQGWFTPERIDALARIIVALLQVIFA